MPYFYGLNEFYAKRRAEAELKAARVRDIAESDSEILDINEQITVLHNVRIKENNMTLFTKEMSELYKQRHARLKALEIDERQFNPDFFCKCSVCHDKGILVCGSRTITCECYINETTNPAKVEQ